MSVTPVFAGRVNEQGQVVIRDRQVFDSYAKTFTNQSVEVILRKPKSQRSLDQNAYWWSVPVRLLSEHTGFTDTETHYALLGECFGYQVGPTGKDIPNKPSSSVLTVEEFSRLIEWVLVWGPQEMGVQIPAPNEVE